MSLLSIFLQITDNGPTYAETLIGHKPFVEPWNSISSLFIAGAGAFFLFKVKPHQPGRGFIYFAAIMLLIGGIGSTLFHGLRTSRWLVYMDFMPIVIVSVAVALIFWKRVVHNWVLATTITLFLLGLRVALYSQQNSLHLTGQMLINISYFISGVTIFLPCLIFLVNTRFHKSNHLFLAIGLMLLALIFRLIDKDVTSALPMGTHFLWHIASGLGAYHMGLYILATMGMDGKKRVGPPNPFPVKEDLL